ncbi:hypothetical protein [Vibrio splendidus]|uniref:hypothetical protein n=1 Tax=Vibrio splendidus TaxID=29497 RepID=UPI00128F5039|nr:hypothetical protein [Vibrio splendidus]
MAAGASILALAVSLQNMTKQKKNEQPAKVVDNWINCSNFILSNPASTARRIAIKLVYITMAHIEKTLLTDFHVSSPVRCSSSFNMEICKTKPSAMNSLAEIGAKPPIKLLKANRSPIGINPMITV